MLDDFLGSQKVPTKFTEFVRYLGVTAYPGQEALWRVLYDGDEPCDLPDDPIEWEGKLTPGLRTRAREFFGDLDVVPPQCRRVICLVIGARAGKTYGGSLRALHLALTCKLPPMAPGQIAWSVIVAPNPRQRDEAFGNVLGAIRSHPHLNAMVIGKPSTEVVKLRRDDGRMVAVESLPANRGGNAGRGRVLVCALLEEAAFFGGSEHVVSDTEVYSALMPRVCTGGQCIISSTPFGESGLLYTEFTANHPNPSCASPHLDIPGRPHRALAAWAPTLSIRDVEETRATIAIEQNRDPIKCAREYFAQFITAGTGQFFDGAALTAALGDVSGPGLAAVGLDMALHNDHVGRVGARLRADGKIVIQIVQEEIPAPEKPLMPSAVVSRTVALAKQMDAESIVSDGVYEGVVREQVAADDTLAHVRVPKTGALVIFTALKVVLQEGRLVLPRDNEQLLRQLRSVRSKELPGGGTSIKMERSDMDGHCDITSALAAVVWRLSKLRPPETVLESVSHAPHEQAAIHFRAQAAAIRERALTAHRRKTGAHQWWRRGLVD